MTNTNNLPEKTVDLEELMANLQNNDSQEQARVTKGLNVPSGYLAGRDVIRLFTEIDTWTLDNDLALSFARALITRHNLPLQEVNEKFVIMHGAPSQRRA